MYIFAVYMYLPWSDEAEVKFIYSEKATNFCEISTVDLSYVVPVKSTVEISQNFVAFSEYMNFSFVINPKITVIFRFGIDFQPLPKTTEDGSTEALLQILYGQYLILGVFGSYMF